MQKKKIMKHDRAWNQNMSSSSKLNANPGTTDNKTSKVRNARKITYRKLSNLVTLQVTPNTNTDFDCSPGGGDIIFD